MSSNNKEYPNDGLSSYSDIRLAYYIYTWNDNKLKQKTAWSTIGTYSINSNEDIIYTSNKNQLIKTNGSNGVSIVKDTYGVIVNDNADVAPTILKINGTYIVGLDNIDGTVSPHTLHTTIPTIDSHLLANTNGINGNDSRITYSNMWGSNTYIFSGTTSSDFFFPFTSYDKGTVIEPVELAVIGKETNGINGITNKGFIYNNYTYKRNVNLINYYNELYNYFKDWRVGSNTLSIDFSKDGYNIVKSNTSAVTILTDFDVMVVSNFATMFYNLYDDNIDIKSGNEYDINFNALLSTYSSLSSIANQINVLLKNTDNDPSSSLLQTPLTSNLLESSVTALACWSYAKDIESLWGSKTTAIVMEKLTANSELFDFTSKSNATSIIGMNNRTSQWVELQLPTNDRTYELVMKDVINSKTGTYSLGNLSQFINQYKITYKYKGNGIDKNTIVITSAVNYFNNTGGSSYYSNINDITLFGYNSNTNIFTWTSNVYFLKDDNFNNSASTFRFIGIDSLGGKFSNDQGSNSIKLTGFNKILLNDLYENPNTYQNADTSYYYYIGDDTQHGSKTSDINEITGKISSYTVSLKSAIKNDQNVLIGGCGSDGSGHTTGSPGFFYIPLPSDIDMNDNSAYVDTHWMLTTWTPNISKNATDRGIINNQDVLYKYTKMNNIITTGLYGGFTPYYNPNNKTTAGIIRIPQISYGVTDYGSPKYVTGDENQIAKLSMIMYTSNTNVTLPNNGQIKFYNYQDGKTNTYIELTANPTPIGNIPPGDTRFKTYFDNYKQFAACVFTLNSNEKNIILQNNLMDINPMDKRNENVAYLDLIGYPDEEFDNLSFDVERKYIFTFNAHIQVTNLNLMSDQINYGTPSLLLVGHFRNRYCKANIPVEISDGVTTNIIYSGRDIFIPLLNKPLENPVNNIYNVEGTYILSWNTTGDSNNEFNDISKYAMYIPKNAKTYTTTGNSSLKQIYENLFKDDTFNGTDIDKTTLSGNVLHFENVLDRIYAFILTGETVNNNFMYQFVNNTTYQDNSNKILSNDDIDLITGRINGSPIFNTSCSYDSNNHEVAITITSNNNSTTITCNLVGADNNLFSSENDKNQLTQFGSDTTAVTAQLFNDGNTIVLTLANKESKVSPLVGIEITVNLIKNGKTIDKAECYDNHLSFDFNTGVDSGILGINEPMLSMTIQRY